MTSDNIQSSISECFDNYSEKSMNGGDGAERVTMVGFIRLLRDTALMDNKFGYERERPDPLVVE